jgi:glycosyltransferase involved in cell wall biosynthesis
MHACLLRAGYDGSMLHGIPDGIPAVPGRRGGGTRLDARLALAAVNPDLNSAVDAPVAICVGRLRPKMGLARLIRAWERVVRHWPTAKLWLIGDGSYRDDLYRLVSDLDLRHSVQMPGTFECLDDVLRAANLLVHPGPMDSIPRACWSAAATGLPIVVCRGPEIDAAIQEQPALAPLVTLLDRDDVAAWSESLIEKLRGSSDWRALKHQGQTLLRQRSMPQMIQQHLALFHRLLDNR